MILDTISESRLAQLYPPFASMIRQVYTDLIGEQILTRVTQGLRSWNEQATIYAQGRTIPGPACKHDGVARPVGTCPDHPFGATVTNAAPGTSWHNFGLAVDLCPSTHGPGMPFDPDWNESHPSWGRIVAVGQARGLVSGATFRTRPDEPHLQLTGRFPVSPTDEVRQLFKDGGVQAVWDSAFAAS